MDKWDDLFNDKFSAFKDMETNQDQAEWQRMRHKVKAQNFLRFNASSFNVYYLSACLVVGSAGVGYWFSQVPASTPLHPQTIKQVPMQPRDSLVQPLQEVPQVQPSEEGPKAVAPLNERSVPLDEAKTATSGTVSDAPVFEEPIPSQVDSQAVAPMETPKVVPKSKFVFKTDTVIQLDTVKVRNKKRYERKQP